MSERFSIAQVTPYAWEGGHDVCRWVECVSRELSARGHRVVVVAPSDDPVLVRESRALIRAAAGDPELLLAGTDGGTPRVLGVGEVLAFGSMRRGTRSLPSDVARTVEQVLAAVPFDLVHVHEPFAPSTASAALRHSHALNVGSFHAPTERFLATQVARRVVELFFGRLDARLASSEATAELLRRHFPADYEVLLPGAGAAAGTAATGPGGARADDAARGGAAGADAPAARTTGPAGTLATIAAGDAPLIAFLHREERPALRQFLRGLRRLDLEPPWRALAWGPLHPPSAGPLRPEVRERLTLAGARECDEAAVLDAAAIAVFASGGDDPAPDSVLRAIAAGAVPVAANLPVYAEVLGEGERGLLFEPGDVQTLAAQIDRLVADAPLRERLRAAAAPLRERLTWSRVADDVERVYAAVTDRRHDERGDATLRRRLASRVLINVDLHMHTDHSHDCATPVEHLLATARERGLGAIAVTDHNEISGALEAREKAAAAGVKVIVGEEVKTASQGEVIGLFLEEKIPRGMTLAETIAEIRRQGGLVYVPHPFDRLHSVPDYEHLLGVLDEIDAIEVYNPRIAFKPFNEEAVRFAAKYRIVAGAGSDAHVAQGLGSVRIRMRDFDGPEEFLESLRDADIMRSPSSLLKVQALKFLETKATPAPARRARRERRVRRAVRDT